MTSETPNGQPTDLAAQAPTRARGIVIAGFVISIVALLLSFAGAGLLPGLAAGLMVAIPKRRAADHGLATAAVIISIVAIVISVLRVFMAVTASS